jgi:hypothetical protein
VLRRSRKDADFLKTGCWNGVEAMGVQPGLFSSGETEHEAALFKKDAS